MRDPAKLTVMAEAEELTLLVYRVTREFPPDERFGLAAQIRRAAVSIGSNIVEGCHRAGSRAFLAFVYQALGSAAEVEYQLRLAMRLEYGNGDDLSLARTQAGKVVRMLIRLVSAIRNTVA